MSVFNYMHKNIRDVEVKVLRIKEKNAFIRMQHKVAKVKKMKKLIQSIYDNDSSSTEEIRPSFNPTAMNLHKTDSKGNSDTICKSKSSNKDSRKKLQRTFSLSTESDEQSEKWISLEEYSNSDNHESSMENKKAISDSARKKASKNKELKSSDSETETHSENSQRRSSQKEGADSSSGKEFQKSKFSRRTNRVKKASEARKDDELDSSFMKHTEEKIVISKRQSLCFKSRVIKILDKCKEVCSEYELRMEYIKWKHFKKELLYLESASNIVNQSRSIIKELKMELDAQEKELIGFHREWSTSCSTQNTDYEDSSSSEDEVLPDKRKKGISDKSRTSSKEGSIISECDNRTIFSDDETTGSDKINGDKDKENENSSIVETPEKSIDDDNNDNTSTVTSPILSRKIIKETSNKTPVKGNSKAVESSEKILETSRNNEDKLNTNKSVNDIFEENVSTPNSLEPDKNEDAIANDSLSQESDSESKTINSKTSKSSSTDEVETTPVKSKKILELIENEGNEKLDSSSELDEEEQAKKALLESDPETPSNDECTVEKPVRESRNSSSKEGNKSNRKKVKSNNKTERGNKMQSTSSYKDISSDEQTELARMENKAKRALLDSNSDDSTDQLSDKKQNDDKQDDSDDDSEDLRVKAKLLMSSNSEISSDSSSDSDTKTQTAEVAAEDTSSSQSKEKSKDPVDDSAEFDISVGERVKKRRTCSSNSNTDKFKSDEILNMVCQVDVERLPKDVLKKHANALEKSRQYLDRKKFKSLVNLDRLQMNKESSNGSSRKNSFKKKVTDKEEKDSLLNYLEEAKKVDFVENTEEGANAKSNDALPQTKAAFQTKEELALEADRAFKKLLLNSSDSDVEGEKVIAESSDSEKEKDKDKRKDQSKKSSPKTEKDSDEEDEKKRIMNKWKRNKILTLKLSSDSDSDARREKLRKNQEKLKRNVDNEDSDIKDVEVKRKRKNRRKIMDSDSDAQVSFNSDSSSDSSVILDECSPSDSDSSKQKKKTRKRKTRKSSDTDTSFSEKRPKPKRKRIKNLSTDSDDNVDNDQTKNSQNSSKNKSRKKIRKVMKDKQVADVTKQAAKEEEERLKRIAERQKLYNEMYETRLANEEKLDKLVLDFDPETKEELVSVHKDLVKRLKPHQAKGVKFMWDACFESLERTKSSPGSGCIVAHCMGLGKTLQVITLAHTLLAHEKIDIKTIMVVCPLNTVLNWRNEFNLWLKDIDNDIEIYEVTKLKQNTERRYMLESWQRTGGVLIIGYEMFRNLSGTNNKMRKNVKESILRCLIDPGPDIIVCDEGHLLKNEDTALSKSMNRIKTLRRIVLTGTPLQNNLIEYHCMVQFIKPNLLGTKKEFLNRFANPITNGQFDDSTEYDVKIMKKRAYVLHKMLNGCVQRFDYTVLTPFLPPKQEYVIFVSLSQVQINMYRYYLENFARQKRGGGGFLFADFQSLQRIWTHPLILQLNAEKIERANEKKISSDSEGSLRNFIDDGSTETTTSSSSESDDNNDVQALDSNIPKKSTGKNPPSEVEINPKPEETEVKEEAWWVQFVEPEQFEDMRVSSKLLLLFGILKECEQIGDKLLVFSQSLYSLTLIERFLEKIDNETQNPTNSENIDGHSGSWSMGLDYFRLDGQTSAENRNIWCKIFNKPSNTRARLFLISTRAGGLGINLTAANRVIIFDASWNPSHDVQSIFRIYRFGQKKPCYVYRFLAAGTMEEKIYNRQVTKLSLSCRVVDVQQIERHYSNNDLSELYKFEPNPNNGKKTLNLPKDRLLAEIFLKYKTCVENYHEHDSLLENKAEEELNEEERKQAWLEYEEEKKGKQLPPPPTMAHFQNNLLLNPHNLSTPFNISTDYEQLQEFIRKDYPNATSEYQQMMTARVLTDMYTYWEQQTYNANKMISQNHVKLPTMRTPVINMAQTSYGSHNANAKPANVDNDIIEILPTTTNKTNKSKEE